mgnify:FL=1
MKYSGGDEKHIAVIDESGLIAPRLQSGKELIFEPTDLSTEAARKELTDKYANGAGVDWKKEIADYADYLKKQGPITPVMPEKAAPVKEKTLKVKGWPFGADRIKEMLAKEKETRKVVEIAPGVKVNFVRIPAGEFVMGS